MDILKKRFDVNGTLPPPDMIEIEPTLGCNLRCVMCHVSYMKAKTQVLNLDALRSFDFVRGKHIAIGSAFEPSIHPEFNRLIDILNTNQNSLTLITNGTRLDRLDVPALYEADFSQVMFSFDGIRKGTYEKIRRNSHFDKTVDNITVFRESFASHHARFSVNSTIMQSNIDETWETIDFWDKHNFDMLRLIFMVIRDTNKELIRESLWPIRDHAFDVLDRAAERLIQEKRRIAVRCPWFLRSPVRAASPQHFNKDIVTSGHPGTRDVPTQRQDFQKGAAFGMRFPCKSPFTFARILWDGTVELCNRFPIGNLNTGTFEDIWYGEPANAVRNTVKARMDICISCDYFKYCIQSQDLDVTRKDYYVHEALQPRLNQINFETGEIAA